MWVGLGIFGVVFAEWAVRLVRARQLSVTGRGHIRALSHILTRYSVSDTQAENTLAEMWAVNHPTKELEGYEKLWWERLDNLMRLRAWIFATQANGRARLRQGFGYKSARVSRKESFNTSFVKHENISLSEIASAGTEVASLYWQLYLSCTGEYSELKRMARNLYQEIFGHVFTEKKSRAVIESLIDKMQGHNALEFLVLNLIQRGDFDQARAIGRFLLEQKSSENEELFTNLYWLGELSWMQQEKVLTQPLEYQDLVRYLYHLCFIAPERAQFLEIDSQFFSEFYTVNEMAKEAFLFVEDLFENILLQWKSTDSLFDNEFKLVLQALSGLNSKVHQTREDFDRVWKRSKASFSEEYLLVIEGNLSYLAGEYEDALHCYQRALEIKPDLRAARLNMLFCYAKMDNRELHDTLALGLVRDSRLVPSVFSVIGNSYLLAADMNVAEHYYQLLSKTSKTVSKKVDFHKSLFCFEQKMYSQALEFALRAYEANPEDSAIRYHLSLCLDKSGKKKKALETLNGMEPEGLSDWLRFYRFTLERDSGDFKKAGETLKSIPKGYLLEEPDELDQAIDFARQIGDFELLLALKRK